MNFKSRHELDSLRSRHSIEVATRLGWGRQVLGRDMIFMSRKRAAWCAQDRRIAEPVHAQHGFGVVTPF